MNSVKYYFKMFKDLKINSYKLSNNSMKKKIKKVMNLKNYK